MTKAVLYDGNKAESVTEYWYDRYGNKIRMTAANGLAVTEYEYDNRGRLRKLTDPMNAVETYDGYDLNGNLIRRTDRNGAKFENTYDGLNRLVLTAAAGGGAVEWTEWTYYDTGAIKKESNKNLTVEYIYDAAGRLTEQRESNGIEKLYGYDIMNNRKTFILRKDGTAEINQKYGYDARGLLLKAETSENGGAFEATEYFYHANRSLSAVRYPNGI